MSDGLPNAEANNEKLLNDISNLQQIESDMLTNLENDGSMTSDQQEKIISKVNNISKMRVNLYKTLDEMNSYYMDALDSSRGTLKEQTQAITIVESELKNSKERLKTLETEKNQKVRLAQINEYYSDKYSEHSRLMKITIAILVPILILAILNQKGILPDFIYYGLIVLISTIGTYFFAKVAFSIFYRDNMNYQAYDWGFDASNAPTGSSTQEDTDSDPWESTQITGYGCVGDDCCGDGTFFDSSNNICSNDSSDPNLENFVNLRGKYSNFRPSTYLGFDEISPASLQSFKYGS